MSEIKQDMINSGWINLAEDVDFVDDADKINDSLGKHLDRMIELSRGDRLTCRYKEVLTMRYGLDGKQPRSRAEVGVFMGVTYERIRQREREALRLLSGVVIGKWGKYDIT